MLETALSYIRRGWFVHPLKPAAKVPASLHGKNDATLDEAQVRAWWQKNPEYNIGISCAPSGLCVMDADHGLHDEAEFQAWRHRNSLPVTYTVRSGRRPEFGVQMYFAGQLKDGRFALDGVSGDIKSAGGLVLAAGSIHPDTRETYQVLVDAPLAPVPEMVERCRAHKELAPLDDDAPIAEARNVTLTRIAGKMRNAGMSGVDLEDYLQRVNIHRCAPPLDEEEVQRIAASVARYAVEPDVAVTIGKAKEPEPEVDPSTWRTLFHTRAEAEEQKDPEFLVRGFLQEESVTGLIGPARARKSIVVLNVIHALLTGEKLFGHFEVPNKPERVVYLCPESGLKSLAKRIRNMGLARFVGESLFFTSMNSDPLTLEDPRVREAVKGSVVFIDTAIRFFDGDENSSQDMKRFGAQCHGLIRDGVRAVVLLHHNSKSAEGLSLEGGRGSGDFGGFLTCCWGTTLDDFENAYRSDSVLACVKQRDFSAASFKVAPSGNDDNFFLSYITGSEDARVTTRQFKGNKDGKDEAALAVINANDQLSNAKLSAMLREHGINRSDEWVRKHRPAKGAKLTEGDNARNSTTYTTTL